MMIGLMLTTAAVGVASGLGYNSMAPRSQLFGRTFIGNGNRRQLALTFDDGPNDPWTGRLLEVLERHSVKATFFMIGRYVALRPGVARDVAAAGHAIGNHTYTHPNLIFASRTQLRMQVEECHRVLHDEAGVDTRLFRPPHGGRRPDVLREVRGMGLETVMWSATGYDWNTPDPAVIEANIMRQVRGGDVLLLHDGGHLGLGTDRSATIAATDRLLRRYRDQGFEFVTVPEMMGRG